MDIHNVAIVRATDVIPFDGVVRPVKDVSFIKKEMGSVYAREMFSLLRRKGLLNPIDWQADESERQAVDETNKKIVAKYMPYTSLYNSMVLWSLNGLVPDDAFNRFSKKSCAIIDGLEEQMERGTEIVSMHPTDTAFKGKVRLSKNAKILIDKARYDTLSEQQKKQLAELDLTVNIFEGDLKTAIEASLKESGRYTAEDLRLVSEGYCYKESSTSEDVAQTIKNIAQEKNIPQISHINVFLGVTNGEEKLDSVKGEKQLCDIIADLYQNAFFEYVFSRLDIDEETKTNAQRMPYSDVYMEELCDEISRLGIDKYKEVLDEYNGAIERLRDSKRLPTPQQIIDETREGRKIDLVSMIRQEIIKEEFTNDERNVQPLCKKTQLFSELLTAQTNTSEEIAIADATNITTEREDKTLSEEQIY